MLSGINEKINNKQYDAAVDELNRIIEQSDDPKTIALSYYCLGYIFSRWEYKKHSSEKASRYLRQNICSEYPVDQAYLYYYDTENDKNVAYNYLKQGVERFPNNPYLVNKLLIISNDKKEVIQLIDERNITLPDVLYNVIEYYISQKEWTKVRKYIKLVSNKNELSKEEEAYIELLEGYSFVFGEDTDYDHAIKLFASSIEKDMDNQLGYSHYIGSIFSYIQTGNMDQTISYFDKLPVNDSIFDLTDGPWYFITVDFEDIYKTIFSCIIEFFHDDEERIIKAKCLLALYLYHPYSIFGNARFTKEDIKSIELYNRKEGYSRNVYLALCNMYCYYKQYIKANDIYFTLVSKGVDPLYFGIDYSQIIEVAPNSTKINIGNHINKALSETYFLERDLILNRIITPLIEMLYFMKQYSLITQISDSFSIKEILSSDFAFEAAYSYGEINNKRAKELYIGLSKLKSDDSSAINNLGVIYENEGDYEKALECFEKAKSISPETSLYINNARQIKQRIAQIKKEIEIEKKKECKKLVKDVNPEFFNSIGYNDLLIDKIDSITDKNVCCIVKRDLRECAIAVALKQTKTATIMIGSVVEAILFYKLKDNGIDKYEIIDKGKQKKIRTIDMSLSQLLYTLNQTNLLEDKTYHLCHYLRDYRNYIHPSKEIKAKDQITVEVINQMWAILKQLIVELL